MPADRLQHVIHRGLFAPHFYVKGLVPVVVTVADDLGLGKVKFREVIRQADRRQRPPSPEGGIWVTHEPLRLIAVVGVRRPVGEDLRIGITVILECMWINQAEVTGEFTSTYQANPTLLLVEVVTTIGQLDRASSDSPGRSGHGEGAFREGTRTAPRVWRTTSPI